MDLPVWMTAFASSFTPDPRSLFHELQKIPRPLPQAKAREDGESITKLSCFRHLGAHLFHELAHGRDVAWRAAFNPFLISLRSFFQVGAERPGDKTLPETWNDRLDHLPYAEKLPAGFEEQVLMQQVVVEQSTGLFPITDNHAGERSRFRTHRSDPHGVLQAGHMIVFEKLSCDQPGGRHAGRSYGFGNGSVRQHGYQLLGTSLCSAQLRPAA